MDRQQVVDCISGIAAHLRLSLDLSQAKEQTRRAQESVIPCTIFHKRPQQRSCGRRGAKQRPHCTGSGLPASSSS
jgi:hypothetical protein